GTLAKLPKRDQQRAARSLAKLYPRLVGIFPTGRGQGANLPAGRLDTSAYPEAFLVAVARQEGSCAEAARTGREGSAAPGGLQRPGRVANRGSALYAICPDQRGPSESRFPYAIRPCGDEPLSSTAGCGKPHVRWCGRVPGRNPRYSTRYSAKDRRRHAEPRRGRHPLLRSVSLLFHA